MKTASTLVIITCLLSSQTVFAEPAKKIQSKKETIIVKGKLGTIKEQRVKSVQSTISYAPSSGAASYDLIGISDSGSEGLNEHVESDTSAIPSWTLFSW